jgi:hypothetical protein
MAIDDRDGPASLSNLWTRLGLNLAVGHPARVLGKPDNAVRIVAEQIRKDERFSDTFGDVERRAKADENVSSDALELFSREHRGLPRCARR